MKTVMLAFVMIICVTTVFAYDSGIAIQTEKGMNMQVYVNGKLYNKQPGTFVRIRSTSGLFHLEVKVLNPWNKQWYLVKKDVHIDKGFDFYYKVIFVNKLKPELREMKRYPIYSNYFLNPVLYNRHPIS